MRLSIITVNFNNPFGLEDTIKSVVNQTCHEFEYIIIDGASTKGDLEIIKKYSNFISYWISEPDKGIYNAMNKGVRVANGDYCLFLNSGDTLYRDNTIAEIYEHDFSEDFIEGIIAFKGIPNKFHFPVSELNLSYYMYKTNNYHQASLIRRQMLIEHPYDETCVIAADMKFNMECIVVNNCAYRALPVIISSYELGGRSETVNHEDERKRIFKDLFPERVLKDYEDWRFMYEWPCNKLYPILYKIGHNTKILRFKFFIKRLLGKKVSESEIKQLNRMIKEKS